MADTASSATGIYAPANYIGLTANANAALVTDAVLTGEVIAGTLIRAQAAYAHTTGTSSYTLTRSFTSDQAITVAKMGIFNADTGGTMAFANLLNAPAVLVSGDQVQLTSTIVL